MIGLRGVQSSVRRLGLDVGRPGGRLLPAGLRRVRVPEQVARRSVVRHDSFTIPIKKVISAAGMSYEDGGFHPFWATAEQLLEDPNLPLDRSWLRHHYASYQPATVHESLFGADHPAVVPLDRLPARYVSVLWTMSLADLRQIEREPLMLSESVHFGPAPDDYLRFTMEQMRRITQSIVTHGYRPFDFPGGIVEGYFLIDGDDFRFVPTEGQHRIGALRALNVEELVVTVRRGLSGVARERLAYWTRRRGRPYSAEAVERLFSRYFEVWSAERLYGSDATGSALG